MRKQKKFEASAYISPDHENSDVGALDAKIYLEKNPSDVRTIDLTPWLDQGIDEWVFAFVLQMRLFQQAKSVTPSTLVAYGLNGVPYFFRFLTLKVPGCTLSSLNIDDVKHFVTWLGEDTSLRLSTKKTRYDRVKPILRALQSRGVISQGPLFPLNPFPNSNTARLGAVPLSENERKRLAEALRNDLVTIYKGSFCGSEGEILVIHALLLAFRTGLNPTPLLELRRDSDLPRIFRTAENLRR